ncbi:hypothetical protein DL98DRAFT_438727, partial [Cadophora sp. DSE1049]
PPSGQLNSLSLCALPSATLVLWRRRGPKRQYGPPTSASMPHNLASFSASRLYTHKLSRSVSSNPNSCLSLCSVF